MFVVQGVCCVLFAVVFLGSMVFWCLWIVLFVVFVVVLWCVVVFVVASFDVVFFSGCMFVCLVVFRGLGCCVLFALFWHLASLMHSVGGLFPGAECFVFATHNRVWYSNGVAPQNDLCVAWPIFHTHWITCTMISHTAIFFTKKLYMFIHFLHVYTFLNMYNLILFSF